MVLSCLSYFSVNRCWYDCKNALTPQLFSKNLDKFSACLNFKNKRIKSLKSNMLVIWQYCHEDFMKYCFRRYMYSRANGPLLPLEPDHALPLRLFTELLELTTPAQNECEQQQKNPPSYSFQVKKLSQLGVPEPAQKNEWSSLVDRAGTWNGKRRKEEQWGSHSWHIQAVRQAEVLC